MPDNPRRPTVSDILGQRYDLRNAVELALYGSSRFDPALVARAFKVRWINRVIKCLQTRPDPEAQVMWYDHDSGWGIRPMEETKQVLLAQWNRYAQMYDLNSRTISVQRAAVNSVVGRVVTHTFAVHGLCVAGGHTQFVALDRSPVSMTYFPSTSNEHYHDLVRSWLRLFEVAPRDELNLALPLMGYCTRHLHMTCDMCQGRIANSGISPEEMFDWANLGCVECRNREWLHLKTPSRRVPTVVKQWLSAHKQFVEVL